MTTVKTVIRTRPEHTISRKNIDEDALRVLYRLSRSGFTAHLVGGGVRDLLLGRQPKDFDIVTDAQPRQIKKLFRNCFLIGRRFRLAHIRFADNKVIETATFRRQPELECDPNDPDADLYRYTDNLFGTPEEDAQRRDFTINGLFYDIRDFSVVDHVGGLEDLERRMIRSIGDPGIRFREDPVRMLRAVRFASRLAFDVEEETWEAIRKHHGEIVKASPPRVLEEIYKLFAYGSGEAAFRLLRSSGLMSDLFPELDADLTAHPEECEALWNRLAALDASSIMDKPTPALLFATLYLGQFLRRQRQAEANEDRVQYAELARETLQPLNERFHMPKQAFFRAIQILVSLRRLEQPGRKAISRLRFLHQESFLETLALYEIGLASGVGEKHVLESWRTLFEERGRPKQRQGERTQAGDESAGEPGAESPEGRTAREAAEGDESEKPRRRRRRGGRSRRKRRPAAQPLEAAQG